MQPNTSGHLLQANVHLSRSLLPLSLKYIICLKAWNKGRGRDRAFIECLPESLLFTDKVQVREHLCDPRARGSFKALLYLNKLHYTSLHIQSSLCPLFPRPEKLLYSPPFAGPHCY